MWYRDLFSNRWTEFWVENYFSESWKRYTKTEVEFLKKVLKRGVTLGLCCGPGRVSTPLSLHREVVSFDLSRRFLLHLKDVGRSMGRYENLNPVRGDTRGPPFKPGAFDNVISLHTSFGYFSDEENELVLREVFRVLKSDCVFVLDMPNPKWIMRNFMDRGWYETNSFYVLERRSLDWGLRRIRSLWLLVDKGKGKVAEVAVDVRLYDLNELENLLMRAGFETVDVFSSPKMEEFHEYSRRIIIVSRKT